MTKPSFAAAIAALRTDRSGDLGHIRPTDGEADAADALEVVHTHHRADADTPTPDGAWGPCCGCNQPWPCPAWLWGQQLAVQWLGRAQDRYWATTARVIAGLDEREPPLPARSAHPPDPRRPGMAEPPTYDRAKLGDQIGAWYAAADAYRAKDVEAVAAALCPIVPGEPDSHTFSYLVASVCVGAMVVGLNLNRANGLTATGPDDGAWVAEVIDPRREGTAVERLCAVAVTTAANGEYDRVTAQVTAFASPSDRGVQRLAEAQWKLLEMFVAVTGGEIRRAS